MIRRAEQALLVFGIILWIILGMIGAGFVAGMIATFIRGGFTTWAG